MFYREQKEDFVFRHLKFSVSLEQIRIIWTAVKAVKRCRH